MLVLHANWFSGGLRIWGESLELHRNVVRQTHLREVGRSAAATATAAALRHPFALGAAELQTALAAMHLDEPGCFAGGATLRLRLPADESGPRPSDRLANAIGEIEQPADLLLQSAEVPCLSLHNEAAIAWLLLAEDRGPRGSAEFAHSLRYWMAVARLVVEMLNDQRFIPTLIQKRGEDLQGFWQPWLHDDATRSRIAMLLAAMPPIARAAEDDLGGEPWAILNEALGQLTDATVRHALVQEGFLEAIEERDASDPHVAWLSGLLGVESRIAAPQPLATDLLRDVRGWMTQLDDTGEGRPFRLCLKLDEPMGAGATRGAPVWRLSFHLRSIEDSQLLIDAQDVWSQTPGLGVLGGRQVRHPQELLLAELGRASRIYAEIEIALTSSAPTGIDLTTEQAYEFLRSHSAVLEEAGVAVIAPPWWDEPASRLGARLSIESDLLDEHASPGGRAGSATAAGPSRLGLSSLVKYRWQIAVGDQAISIAEFQELVKRGSPLVQIRGQWVEIRPEDMASAAKFLETNPAGEMTALQALRLAYGSDGAELGLPVLGMDATGWLEQLFAATADEQRIPPLSQPDGFIGSLRPYQATGLRWLAFLDRLGLGACLADDMGLGKTIQLIALLLHEREAASEGEATDSEPGSSIENPKSKIQNRVGPTLLVVPTSVVTNWTRELDRFAPALKYHVHHGPTRPMEQRFAEIAATVDIVITTYALLARDLETLKIPTWHRVALDEAQYIKNPPTKQAAAIRSLSAVSRVALTGTPVENRLSELWSIMEFCNPGYLGTPGEFRRRFAVPIERHREKLQAERLRQLVRPFVLRRLKTDSKVISDLPDCLETKEFATLTTEQAALYQQLVDGMLMEVDAATGIQRRGLVLATLVKLKQICNHPAQLLKEAILATNGHQPAVENGNGSKSVSGSTLSERSGKTRRLTQMLEEVIAAGGRALIFTQFRQMGHLLSAMIEHDLDCETMFLHGGSPTVKRQQMIDRFQAGDVPVFILSLKAGGLGLNLTAANHVFHFDRWWNPAVESQATDRAFRIGQTRTVHVHKFVCVGTLEERIDEMIEQKVELARNIIGSGEDWLTELSTGQLRDLLTLRQSALEEGA